VAWSLIASGSASAPASVAEREVRETDVEFKTPDGTCDAAFFHPASGSHPGVLIWHDSGGLRPAFRELGRRLAAEGYAVLVPNLFYRAKRAPHFDASFDINKPESRELYRRTTAGFFAEGSTARDAVAYVEHLDAQPQVDRKRKLGTHGYCLGGPYVLRTAAAMPDRVGAAASFHGGFLVTDKPDSPHRLATKIKARLYFAIASDDDAREPTVKDALREAFAAAGTSAEIELFPNARHGFCVPDSASAKYADDAARAWKKLVALYAASL
jgi:carboxymethylenebutenolidase